MSETGGAVPLQVPSSGFGVDSGASLTGEEIVSPPVSPEKMVSVVGGQFDQFIYLTKKLVHLSVLLEQDTVSEDTRYPTF